MQASAQFLFSIGAILLFAIAADILGKRTFLPRVTLLLLFGVLIGKDALNLIPSVITNQFEIIANIALLMVGFLIGGKFSRRSIKNSIGKTLWIAITAAIGTTLIVSFGLTLLGVNMELAILLGCIASATAPAATVDVISELNYKNSFAKLLISVVAIDDAVGLMLFSIGIACISAISGVDNSIFPLAHAIKDIGGAILLGGALGLPAAYLTGRLKPGQPMLAEALGIVFLCGGFAAWLNVSFLLASMVMGCVIVNLAKHHEYPFHAIEGIEWIFLIIFFTLAGASLSLKTLATIGTVAIAYMIFRTIGKILGGYLGSKLGHAGTTAERWMGPSLLPQAGVAVGMALVASNQFPKYEQYLLSIVISTTIIFEVLGPIVTRFSLRQANKEMNKR